MRFILYCRRSSDREDKQALSIESQERTLREIATRRDLKVVKVIKESMSAKEPGRPGFNEMIKCIDEKQADGILCWKHDRLSRNPIDYGVISYKLQKGVIKQIVTAERDYNPEDNVLLMAVEGGMANQYIRDLSRNVQRGLRTKIQNGWLPNKPPCGWMYDKNTKTIVKDEYNFPKVQDLLKIALRGSYTPIELEKLANNKLHIRHRMKGELIDRRVGKSYIFDTLRNPFHAGILMHHNERFPGAHAPMITEAEHYRLLELYGNASKRGKESPMNSLEHPHKYVYKLGGAVRCPCGRQVSPWRIKNRPGGKEYLYYSCSSRFNGPRYKCGQPIIVADQMEAAIRDELSKIQIDPRLLEWVKTNLGTSQLGEEQKQKDLILSLQRRKEQLVVSQKRLLDHLLNESITSDTYQGKNVELRQEIESLDQEIVSGQGRIERWKQETQVVIDIADKLVKIFDGDDFTKTKQMLRSVFESISLNGGRVETKLCRPFQGLQSEILNINEPNVANG